MQTVNLNLIPGGVMPVVNVSQYDEGRQFALQIYNGSASYDLTGKTITVQGMKADHHGFDYGASDTVNGTPVVAATGNTVTITTPTQMTAAAGRATCELRIVDSSDNTVHTLNFNLEVEASALPADSDMSASDYSYVETLLLTAESINTHTPYIGANGNWWVYSVQAGAYVDTGVDASITVQIADVTMLAPDATPTVTNSGTATDPVFHLGIPRGKGISGIAKTGTSGLVDTYTITYSDGATYDYTVTNGAKGDTGATGATGPTGATPDITMSATVDNTTGTPAVTVTKTGTDENPAFALAFEHLKGAKGDTGEVSEAELQTAMSGQVTLTHDTVGWTGKNRLDVKAKSVTHNGITWSVSNGVVTANGETSGTAWLILTNYSNNINLISTPIFNAGEKVIFSSANNNVTAIGGRYTDGTYTSFNCEQEYTLEKDIGCLYLSLSNTTVSDMVIKPMVRDAVISDSTFEPHHEDVNTIIGGIKAVDGITGAKNMFDYSFNSGSSNGITWTVNANKTLTVDGEASAATNLHLFMESSMFPESVKKGVDYKITALTNTLGCVVQVFEYINNNWSLLASTDTIAPFRISDTATGLFVRVSIPKNSVLDNVVVYPMIIYAEETDYTYAQYAMTNRELTEKVQGIISAAKNAADFAAFKTAISAL